MPYPTLEEEIELLRAEAKDLADELEGVLRRLHDRERELARQQASEHLRKSASR